MPKFEDCDGLRGGPEAARWRQLQDIRRRILGDKYDTEGKLREALARLLQDLEQTREEMREPDHGGGRTAEHRDG